MTREEAMRLASEALERQGLRVTGGVGAARYFSLIGLWFRWSIGLHVQAADTGDWIIGDACVTVSEVHGSVVSLWAPPRGGHRIHDPFWRPPEPLWWRVGFCLAVPPLLLAYAVTYPFVLAYERAAKWVRPFLLPRCRSCRLRLRSHHLRRCLRCGDKNPR